MKKGATLKYLVVLERGEHSFGAYVPDLPGCVAVGETADEALKLIKEAIELHLEAMQKDGLRIPQPVSSIQYVDVAVA